MACAVLLFTSAAGVAHGAGSPLPDTPPTGATVAPTPDVPQAQEPAPPASSAATPPAPPPPAPPASAPTGPANPPPQPSAPPRVRAAAPTKAPVARAAPARRPQHPAKRVQPTPLLADLFRHEFPPVGVLPHTAGAPDRGLLALAGATLALVALCGGVVATGAGLSLRRA